jgi:hypothetical protein
MRALTNAGQALESGLQDNDPHIQRKVSPRRKLEVDGLEHGDKGASNKSTPSAAEDEDTIIIAS